MLVLLSTSGNTQNKLVDIGKDMDKLTGTEKVFYNDRLSTEECRLSNDIDEEYELEVHTKQVAAPEVETHKDNKVFHALENETDKELSNDKMSHHFCFENQMIQH